MNLGVELAERRLRTSVATLVTPAHPNAGGVILAHGGSDDGRRFFEQAAVELARGGYTVALPATRMSLSPDWADTEASIRHATAVHREALDLLATQSGVNPDRLGYYGHSSGAFQGAILLGCEPRLHALVLAAFGAGTARRIARQDRITDAGYLAALDRLDPSVLLGRPHHAPILLQFGERDQVISKAEAQALSAAAQPPMLTRWYDCDHGVDADPSARADRRAFFDEHLLRPAA